MSDLKGCPHCGGAPWFNYRGWQDDNRYVEATLQCCATMTANIGWSRARGMTEAAQQSELRIELTTEWNKRYVEEEDE